MADQPSPRPLTPSSFFADGASARPPVPGTVARGQARLDRAYYEGLRSDAPMAPLPSAAGGAAKDDPLSLTVARTDLAEKPYIDYFPIRLDAQTLRSGQTRFMAFCAPCHGGDGAGRGPVVQRGFTPPPTLHSDRLRAAPPGYFFDVVTRGYGSMPAYAKQIPVPDRWAIAAYVRALQMSRHARLDDLPADLRETARAKLEDQSE